ncbi:MAG: DNA-processing protein DprA [Candidatus Baltobacteraceae bacterium]
MEPRFEPRERFLALRPGRAEPRFAGLWATGSLEPLARPSIAIVGTRAASAYGRSQARSLAAELAGLGLCVLSGLALGIDAAAHEGALDAGAPTIGVLGSGHRCFYPPRNAALAARMLAAGGAVLSPFPPDEPARRGQFLARNGVVVALADALLVVEAPLRSGALNTASWAAGEIPVLALPSDVDRRSGAGSLALLRDGATLVRGAADIVEAMGLLRSAEAPPTGPASDEPAAPADALIALLRDGAATIEDLVAASGLPTAEVLGRLNLLELCGAIECRAAGYALAHRPRKAR